MAAPAKDPIASPQFFLGLLVQELRNLVVNNNFDSQTQIASLLEEEEKWRGNLSYLTS